MECESRELHLQVEEALRVLDKCIFQIRWRLRPQAKRRLALDIVALSTKLRPVIMVDYGGKMPELQQHLCDLLHIARQESLILRSLRVMVIEEMVYLVHVEAMLEHMHLNLSLKPQLQFAILDQGPPKLSVLEEQNAVFGHFISIQKLLSSIMSSHAQDAMNKSSCNSHFLNISNAAASASSGIYSSNTDPQDGSKLISTVGSLDNDPRLATKFSELIDLTQCMRGTQVAPPTLNGWLLGYPIVYLFNKEDVSLAVQTLSTVSLHLFRILICSEVSFGKEAPEEEELMSFSVPAELSSLGKDEPWAETFFMRMLEKLARCKQVWRYMKLEVTKCKPQSIAL